MSNINFLKELLYGKRFTYRGYDALLHKNTKPGEKEYRVTFLLKGKPMGHLDLSKKEADQVEMGKYPKEFADRVDIYIRSWNA